MSNATQRADGFAATFTEHLVQVGGVGIRYLEAGQGSPVVVLHGSDGLTPSPLNNLLAQQFRVIAFEIPGFGRSVANERSQSMRDLAHTLAEAATALGLERYGLVSTAISARIALWQAIDQQERIDSLVLVSPAALLPEGWAAPSGTAEQVAKLLYAHPEKLPSPQPEDPETAAKQRALTARLRDFKRDPELERRLGELKAATLVLFGTRDGVIPPEIGRLYVERIPNCYYALVYDAGHVIEAERPEALFAAVRDFLEHRETFVVSRKTTVINP
ncbi:MAG: alpha/beta fold hydrolase [Deltaproteobacteria bacterium]|nr:alpha/beta fold hydrolase [Deltaproteobacteria bacterium]